MRITYLTEFFPEDDQLKFTGGIESAVYQLVKNLSPHHQINVLYRPQKQPQSHLKIQARLIPCGQPRGSGMFDSLNYLFQLIKQGVRIKADLIVGTNFTTFIPAWIIGKITHTPVVIMYADVLLGRWGKNFKFPISLIGEITERFVLLLPFNAYLPISQTTADLLKRHVPQDKIHPCLLGVNINEINQFATDKTDTPMLLAISRLVTYKRLDDLISAVNILKKKYPHINCEIIGTGPMHVHLQSLIDQYQLQKHVKLLGHATREEVISKLHQAKIFCLPSIVEGFGLVTLESLAAGTPYVNADIPVTREITKDGLGGLFHKPQDPNDLAKQIDLLLSDPQVYKQKQHQARELVSNYDWVNVAQNTFKIYTQVIKK